MTANEKVHDNQINHLIRQIVQLYMRWFRQFEIYKPSTWIPIPYYSYRYNIVAQIVKVMLELRMTLQ
jgi:hypothetical protein